MIIFFGFGLWFWGLVILEICLLTWFVEEEWAAPSFLSLVVFLVLLSWLAKIPVWEWIRNNPAQLAMYCLYYIIAGIVWSMGKYFFILKKIRKDIKEARLSWESMKSTEEYRSFKEFVLKEGFRRSNDKYKVGFESSTSKLVFWATFWPTSLLWTIINDPIKKLFKFLIHDVFIAIYRTMYNKMVGDLLEERDGNAGTK